MAGLLSALLLSYVGPIRGLLDQRASLHQERAHLAALQNQRDDLRARIAGLNDPAVLATRARELGMVAPGEQPYVVRGDLTPAPKAAPKHDDGTLGWLRGLF